MTALEARRDGLTADSLRLAQLQGASAGRPFIHAARAALKAGDAARAFGYVQRAKARTLLELMAAGNGLARSDAARRWREADARLALSRGLLVQAAGAPEAGDLQKRVLADEAALTTVERELAEAEPRWREAMRPTTRVLALDAVAERLPNGALLLEYALHGDDLLAFAVTCDGLAHIVRHRGDGRGLAVAIAKFWGACYSGHPEWRALAAPVEAALVAPFAAQIGACSRLLVAPSGPAHRLPFAALYAGGEPLIAGRPLVTVPSASALDPLAPDDGAHGPLLALGAPSGMTYNPAAEDQPRAWAELPWAGAAAAYVADLFPGSLKLLGDDATEGRLRTALPHHALVLLATHAEVEEAPPRAFVVLAGGDGLDLHELMGLDLSAVQLVVLAACETAGGSLTGGEEVVGLTRGLLAAGAARAIVTLWKTDAASLPLLVRALFARLHDGQPVAEALRGAQLEVATMDVETARQQRAELRAAAAAAGHPVGNEDPRPVDFAHPRHWAPYILAGR
jgi:CHAT domain-containing protein